MSLVNKICNPPIDAMQAVCANDLSSRGPYIFTYTKPASNLQPLPPPFLFVDLSDVHERAFAEFISAFKAQVKREDISDAVRLSSLRLRLLSIVFDGS